MIRVRVVVKYRTTILRSFLPRAFSIRSKSHEGTSRTSQFRVVKLGHPQRRHDPFPSKPDRIDRLSNSSLVSSSSSLFFSLSLSLYPIVCFSGGAFTDPLVDQLPQDETSVFVQVDGITQHLFRFFRQNHHHCKICTITMGRTGKEKRRGKGISQFEHAMGGTRVSQFYFCLFLF